MSKEDITPEPVAQPYGWLVGAYFFEKEDQADAYSRQIFSGRIEKTPLYVAPVEQVAQPVNKLVYSLEEKMAIMAQPVDDPYLRVFGVSSTQAAQPTTFQARVQPWMMECFGPEISADTKERNYRFLEEALELVQVCGCTQPEADQLVAYVYGRPVGEKHQEVGGVMVTLAALCLAQGIDMDRAAETELARIWTKVEKIRAKHATKPKHSPLPESAQIDGDACAAAFDISADEYSLSGHEKADAMRWFYLGWKAKQVQAAPGGKS